MTSRLSRKVFDEPAGIMQLDDLQYFEAMGQYVDTVIAIQRPVLYVKEKDSNENNVSVHILKNSSGGVGSVGMFFDERCEMFRSI